jgi:hypothetical protein
MRNLLTAIAVLFLASAVSAQQPAPIVNVGASYTFARTDLASSGGGNEHLAGVNAAVRVNSWASGRVDYLKFTGSPDAQVALFGIEARRSLAGLLPASDVFKPSAFQVFAVAQGGFARTAVVGAKPDNDFALSIGGGLDFTETRTDGIVVLRVFEVRYLRANLFDGGKFFKNSALVQTGVQFRF